MAKKEFSFDTPRTKPETQETDKDLHQFIDGQQGNIVRKTIALPEEQFIQVKIEAAKRRIPAYKLWGEIVDAYFKKSKVTS